MRKICVQQAINNSTQDSYRKLDIKIKDFPSPNSYFSRNILLLSIVIITQHRIIGNAEKQDAL